MVPCLDRVMPAPLAAGQFARLAAAWPLGRSARGGAGMLSAEERAKRGLRFVAERMNYVMAHDGLRLSGRLPDCRPPTAARDPAPPQTAVAVRGRGGNRFSLAIPHWAWSRWDATGTSAGH